MVQEPTLTGTSWDLLFRGESFSSQTTVDCRVDIFSNLELLRAAQKYAKGLKHFTFTGSLVTVHDIMKPYDGRVLTADDWNPADPEIARQMQHGGASYVISKTLAERAFWEFVDKEKPSFTVSVLSV